MIKNYTSGVPASRSIHHIEDLLISHGAKNVIKDYSTGGHLDGMAFVIPLGNKDIPFRFSAKTSQVIKAMREKVRRARKDTFKKIEEQAERTAWKILSDSIEIQLTLVDLGQKELLEVFLSDAYDFKSKQTLFEKVKDGSIKLLTDGGK